MLKSISSFFSPAERGRPARHNRLATRLTALILVVTVPVLIGVNLYVSTQAGSLIEQLANTSLYDSAERIDETLITWLKLNGQAVQGLAAAPGMSSMDPAQQLPILQAMASAYPDMFLIHTVGLDGLNVARSDKAKPLSYTDRQWFIQAKNGTPFYEVVISKTIGKPVLAIGAPIKDAAGNIVGVAAGISKLDQVNASVSTTLLGTATVGKTGYVYVVDAQNQLILHPDPAQTSGSTLQDKSSYPPVVALRQGLHGFVDFTDDQGMVWRAYIIILANHWAVIAQEPQNELLAPLYLFRWVATIVSLAGALVLLVIALLIIRQTLKPIDKLSEVVEAITAGDLTRTAEVTSQDEIGLLAVAFNNMTAQLRDLIGNLEQHVKERTTQLDEANEQNANRSKLLRSIAEITRSVSSIQSMDKLLPTVTEQISIALGLYHVGIFRTDQSRQYAVLQASNSEAGKKMIARNYRVKIDQSSLVGFVANTGQARIASDVGDEAIPFNDKADLADTRSEMALPLRIGDNIIGVLDLHSTEPSALTGKEIDTLTLLADQVSIVIQNNLSFDETRAALAKSEATYQQSAVVGWHEFLHQGKTGYRYVNGTIEVLNQPVEKITEAAQSVDKDPNTISIPIVIRGKQLGMISIRQSGRDHAWDENETRTLQSIVDRLSFALENARLYSDAQQRASKERVIGEITTKIRGANDPNEMIRVAIDELKQALNINDVRIVPYNPPQNGNGHKEG